MKTTLSLLALIAFTAAFVMPAMAAEPVNAECPVCHKPIRLIFHSKAKDGKRVAFATPECQEKFDKSPDKYSVKTK